MTNLNESTGKNKANIRPAYARFYASKWRSGTLMLSLEEEGLYIRISAFQMECGQPMPADWKEGARLLCVQPLKYRKTIDSLITKGKIQVTPDGLICERAMAEFKRATKGVGGEDQNPPTYPDTNPVCNPDSMGVEAKKDQQNQDHFRNRREEKKESRDSPDTPAPEPERASEDPPDFVECKSAFNGSTETMLAAIEAAMGASGDRARAAQWLASLLRTNDQHSVAQSFQMFLNAKAEGQVITHLLRYWSKTASSLKANPQAGASRFQRNDGSRMMEILNRKSAEART